MASKIQRKVNRAVRSFNKILETDWFLQNRFRVRQIKTAREDDVQYFMFEITDSITENSSTTHWYNQYEFQSPKYLPFHLYGQFNDFIMKRLYNLKG